MKKNVKNTRSLILQPTLIFALVISLVACNPNQENQAQDQAEVSYPGEVSITIQDGKSKSRLTVLVAEKSNLLSIMEAQKIEQKLSFEVKGEGDMTFVESLNGVKNEGPGDDKHNWLFAVNGRLANQGIGQLQISANDSVTWCFLLWKDRDQCK